jgi:hypothetical protein
LRRDDQVDEGVSHRRDLETAVDRRSCLDVVAAADVADDDQVRPRREMQRVEALETDDAPARKLGADGRVERDVRSGHLVPHRLEQTGEGAHSGPRHGYAMDAHLVLLRYWFRRIT